VCLEQETAVAVKIKRSSQMKNRIKKIMVAAIFAATVSVPSDCAVPTNRLGTTSEGIG
jgi:hypothetical protein